jgi:acyl CoA:acetate/3-ketoacid CoA transferase
MEFRPAIAADLRPMDPAIFAPGPLGLRARWEAEAGRGAEAR